MTQRTTGATPRNVTNPDFWMNVDKNGPIPIHNPELGECWSWKGVVADGYGKYFKVRAHRHSYEQDNGPIPTGLVIDHLCRNPSCVRPSHLEAVTHSVNVLRGMSPTIVTKREGVCRRGHQMEGKRNCPVCRKKHWGDYRKRSGSIPIGTTRNCARCGNKFQMTGSSNVYCSIRCRRDSNNDRRKANHWGHK